VLTMDWPPAVWNKTRDKSHNDHNPSEDEKWHQEIEGPKLMSEYAIKDRRAMTDCSTCHR
jgi:hypothetical protein